MEGLPRFLGMAVVERAMDGKLLARPGHAWIQFAPALRRTSLDGNDQPQTLELE